LFQTAGRRSALAGGFAFWVYLGKAENMATGTLVSVQEYLSSSFEPDRDYVDGVLEERNLGEFDHARLQMVVASYFYSREKQLGITVVPEQRVQVGPTRFRVPDVCVTLGIPGEQVFTKPPFICVEILSPDDRLSRIQERITDYLNMGVQYVWLLDPQTRNAWHCTAEGMLLVSELRTENPEISIPVAGLFEA
jgi:Uma2 family endonuclease